MSGAYKGILMTSETLELDAENAGSINSVIYDRYDKGYRLEQIYRLKFTNSEVLALSKILWNSRAFTKRNDRYAGQTYFQLCAQK